MKEKTTEEIVDELAKFEQEQRKKEGDEARFKELSNSWLKLKINHVEEEWKAEKFDECQITHGMAGGASRGAEKELELAQQEAHMVEKREPEEESTQVMRINMYHR